MTSIHNLFCICQLSIVNLHFSIFQMVAKRISTDVMPFVSPRNISNRLAVGCVSSLNSYNVSVRGNFPFTELELP